MSYCVECGVSLDESLSKCPLCQTKVYNPNRSHLPAESSHYPPVEQEDLTTVTKKSFLILISIAFLFPAVVCIFIDLLTTGRFTWSFFAIGALFTVWINLFILIIVKKYKPYTAIFTGAVTLSGYLWSIEKLTLGNGWFGHLALPIVLFLALGTFILISSIRHRLIKELDVPACFLVFLSLFLFVVELLLSSFLSHNLSVFWSPIACAPCVLLAFILFLLQRNPSLKLALEKIFHF